MMTFDPQKRITPSQALKHPYFEGFVLNPQTSVNLGAGNSNKNFFNAANDFQKPGSKARIESRKGVLSRKSSINKNSFYRSKAVGKLPDYLPNKPTVVGSRGQNLHSGYLNRGQDGKSPTLPSLAGSGGVAVNSAQKKPSNANNQFKAPSLYKYGTGGLGGGLGGGMASYGMNYNQNS